MPLQPSVLIVTYKVAWRCDIEAIERLLTERITLRLHFTLDRMSGFSNRSVREIRVQLNGWNLWERLALVRIGRSCPGISDVSHDGKYQPHEQPTLAAQTQLVEYAMSGVVGNFAWAFPLWLWFRTRQLVRMRRASADPEPRWETVVQPELSQWKDLKVIPSHPLEVLARELVMRKYFTQRKQYVWLDDLEVSWRPHPFDERPSFWIASLFSRKDPNIKAEVIFPVQGMEHRGVKLHLF
jgi:hypothetical protein